MSASSLPKKRSAPSKDLGDRPTKSWKQVKFSRPSTDMDVQHQQEPLLPQHSLEQLNADPALLTETFAPALTANQQASDLRHITMYNNDTRKLVESSYQLWRKHRGLTCEEIFAAVDHPLYDSHPTFKISNPAKATQVAITFHRLFQSAKNAGHTNLATQSAKKLLDYHIFCLLAVSELEERNSISQQTAWFKEVLEFLPPSAETSSSNSLPQSSSAQVCLLPTGSTSVAGPPASLSAVPDLNGLPSTAMHDSQHHDLIDSMICKDFSNVSDWEDIALDAQLKRRMKQQLLLPLTIPTAYADSMIEGVFLHGVPGCGKTYLCQAIAKSAGITFFDVECSSLISKWQGESEKLITLLFTRAIERQPSIIFFDEVERLTKQRDSSDTFGVENIKGAILVQMSKIQARGLRVTVIGASNRPYSIDEAFVRRFPLKLHVPPPDTPMKIRLLQIILNKYTHRLGKRDIARLANDPVLESASAAHMTDVIRMLSRKLSGSFDEAEYFDKRTQHNGVNVIVPYKHDPTLPLPEGIVQCSWKDFTVEERSLIRSTAIQYQDLYDAFEESPSPIDAAAIQLHLQWSRDIGTGDCGNELRDEMSLEDLGIDSLLVTEVLNEVQANFDLKIDLNTFHFFPNLEAICIHIDSALGVAANAPPAAASITPAEAKTNGVAAAPSTAAATLQGDSRPSLPHAQKVFEGCKDAYERAAVETQAVEFWEKCYPRQAALVLAYVVEAFANLGCDLSILKPGDSVPEIPHLDRHKQVVRQYYSVLEDAHLINVNKAGQFTRMPTPVDRTPASTLFAQIIPDFPHHANVHKVVQAVGSELAPCLTGDKDGLQIVFGNKENKKSLDDLYENWPLVRSGTIALGEFLGKAMANPSRQGKFRILEVGGGTGGTTKYIIPHLQKLGVPFEYVFTDLSPSLVSAAKRIFKDCPEMSFATLDIEKEPPADWVGSFHVALSTNCIHATHDLTVSLTSLRRLLRPDGVLTLVEITRNMFWLDVAVGLFEGWWMMDDGRTHAVTHQDRWKKDMLRAGFAAVDWTDGDTPEAQTIRVIAGFASDVSK